ncbi:Ohr family peroxiredoxin [Sphingomonas sp. H160509]|uniref:Ohr family peroxiredoxin n=1 Tax=Sphingomonas sp. H160509 TaxID=2955313 RepID=UPI0020984143|nr:Ohr family peroxiredoxin [Sphingomonas sp. H160509]MDD1453279.1 Ohr family peroxiredoxin [Sphingomonas sp. H160509]
MKILYRAEATAIGGREGSAATADGSFRIGFATPKDLGGDGRPGNNPEQLFAAGYAACFLDAIKRAAVQARTYIAGDSNVTVTVGLMESEGAEGVGLTISIAVDLPGTDDDLAKALMLEAHATCPYSRATQGNVPVRLQLA